MVNYDVTTAAGSLEFDTQDCGWNCCYPIDSNHYINFWQWVSSDWYVQVFEINTSTRAVTTAGASLEFDTINWTKNSCYPIDSNHYISFWQWSDTDWYVQVFEVNTSTRAVTTAAASLEFDTVNNSWNSCYPIDINHYINFYSWSDGDWYVEVFEVNTSTRAVTTTNTCLLYTSDAADE